MDEIICCQECKLPFKDSKSLHLHLRAHKISQAYYYQKYFPRYDKFDGHMIKFKSLDFYLSNDFNSRVNAISWLKTIPLADAQPYIINFLVERKRKKGLQFLPAQVELRSLPIAGIKLMNDIFGNYNKLGELLGLQSRFSNELFSGNWKPFNKKHKIIIDTREQKPLSFSIKTKLEALSFGDYALNDSTFSHDCHIERKSLGDFYSTLSIGLERFKREIERAKDSYLIVLVEEPLEEVYEFTSRYQVTGKTRISPEYVLHNMRTIMQEYNYVQFLFVRDRTAASHIIERIFQSDGKFKKIDLQYSWDIGNLT